jgi:3-isopropylmalate/(R)-2-methylmalate dehydratase small subunit
VLITGPNFGCGSSREHAPWGLQQYGFAAVIAPSFADIFRINCEKVGLLAVQLPPETCSRLLREAAGDPSTVVRIDLAEQEVSTATVTANFDIDPFTKRCLLEGLDDIALTLQHDDKIAAFEAARSPYLPVAGR